jgi:hypothetical protein
MIDDVQEWLHSLHGLNTFQGFEPLPDDPNNPLEAMPGMPLSGDLNKLDIPTLEMVVIRAAKYRHKYPTREPNRSPDDIGPRHISYKDIMALHSQTHPGKHSFFYAKTQK